MTRMCFNDYWRFCHEGAGTVEAVTLPHDAMIHGQRAADNPSGAAGAYFPGGVYVYEKSFDVPTDWAEKSVWFEFEGVYQNARVYLNGQLAGGRPYGYIPFTIEADGYLEYGRQNSIRVVADNADQPNSRWYTGGGIYRPVWLHMAGKTHIRHQGVKVTTLSHSPARIQVDTAHTGDEGTEVYVEVLDGDAVAASGRGRSVELEMPAARLWRADAPNLYRCRVTLRVNGAVLDEVTEYPAARWVRTPRQRYSGRVQLCQERGTPGTHPEAGGLQRHPQQP